MSELKKHLEALNAKTQAWMDEVPGRWAGFYETDPAWWAELGITTVEEFERSQLISTYSDVYKDTHGFRPRPDYSALSTDDLRQMVDDLFARREREAAWEAEYQAKEDAEIAQICEANGIDRETYDRWMSEAKQPLWKWQEEVEFSYCMMEDIYEVA